jgi:hypothetical protein
MLFFECAAHHTGADPLLVTLRQYSQYSDRVPSGYFSPSQPSWLSLRVTHFSSFHLVFGVEHHQLFAFVSTVSDKGFAHIKSGGYFPN